MDPQTIDAFVRSWIDAWNAHDPDRVLEGFHSDASFASPLAATLAPGSDGRLVGRDAIRAYWQRGLSHVPDLHFTLVKVYAGVDSLAIVVRDRHGRESCEILILEDGRVRSGFGAYPFVPETR